MPCYCHSKLAFANCCEPVITHSSATSPEQLMRSRFSAYVSKNYAYILSTYAPEYRQGLSIETLAESAQNTSWLHLELLESAESGNSGVVEFIATYASDGAFFKMHERSSFVKQNDVWFYTTGVMKEKSGQVHPARNDTCPCGSGKKFKKCCVN